MNEASRDMRLPEVGDTILEKYKLTQKLGQGGMGIVFAATHLELHEDVALKILLPEMAQHEEIVGRFMREARAAARIKSEHAVRVIDVGKLQGTVPYMVMEYLEGEDLEHLLRKRQGLPLAEAIGYIRECAVALAEAHRLGIVHRDIKPANLFLATRSNGARLLKVLDFGISKVANDSLLTGGGATRTDTVMGTPMYMSPEQLRSTRDVDARADVWSLGVVFYELITGAHPFEAESVPVLYAAILGAPYKPIRERRPDLPAAIEAVIAKCLDKDRENRFASVDEFVQAIEPFANSEDEGVSPGISNSGLKAGNWTRRAMVSTILVDTSPRSSFRSGKTMALAGIAGLLLIAGGFVAWNRFKNEPQALPQPQPQTIAQDKPAASSPAVMPAEPSPPPTQALVQPMPSTATSPASTAQSAPPQPAVVATTALATVTVKTPIAGTKSPTNNKVFDVGGRK